jgi:hypothetical protein
MVSTQIIDFYSKIKNYLKKRFSHGVIEMFFFSTYADLIEFPLILDSPPSQYVVILI